MPESRPQKYFGSLNDCPITDDPTRFPSRSIKLPFDCFGKAARATPVTSKGYAAPVRTVIRASMTRAGRNSDSMAMLPSRKVHDDQQEVDQLDANERHDETAEAVNQNVLR